MREQGFFFARRRHCGAHLDDTRPRRDGTGYFRCDTSLCATVFSCGGTPQLNLYKKRRHYYAKWEKIRARGKVWLIYPEMCDKIIGTAITRGDRVPAWSEPSQITYLSGRSDLGRKT